MHSFPLACRIHRGCGAGVGYFGRIQIRICIYIYIYIPFFFIFILKQQIKGMNFSRIATLSLRKKIGIFFSDWSGPPPGSATLMSTRLHYLSNFCLCERFPFVSTVRQYDYSPLQETINLQPMSNHRNANKRMQGDIERNIYHVSRNQGFGPRKFGRNRMRFLNKFGCGSFFLSYQDPFLWDRIQVYSISTWIWNFKCDIF